MTVRVWVTTAANRYWIPVVTADPSAAFIAEGAESPITGPTLAEQTVTPGKVAG